MIRSQLYDSLKSQALGILQNKAIQDWDSKETIIVCSVMIVDRLESMASKLKSMVSNPLWSLVASMVLGIVLRSLGIL